MKALLLSIIIVLFSLQSFSQYHENYQPDSVYKINGIKARIMMHNRSKTKTKQLDLYDKQGRHTASIQVDTSGSNYRSKTVFDYDSTGRLQHQYGINYYRLDSSTRKMLKSAANPDTNTVKIVYDSLNRISAKYWISAKGKKYFETFFTYNPLTTTEHQYLKRNDTDYINEAITIYEVPEIASRRYGYYLDAKPGEPKRQRNNFDFSYENTFDKEGRLIKRLTGTTDPAFNTLDKSLPFAETTYQYSINGLLIKQTTTNEKEKKSILLFDYKFW